MIRIVIGGNGPPFALLTQSTEVTMDCIIPAHSLEWAEKLAREAEVSREHTKLSDEKRHQEEWEDWNRAPHQSWE